VGAQRQAAQQREIKMRDVRRSSLLLSVTPAGVSSARADIPLAADWQRDRLAMVAFVQDLRGRRILASASVSLQKTRR
jgi:hypothetical protein